MDVEEFRQAGYQAIDQICDLHNSLGSRPVKSTVEPGYLRRALPSVPPETGEDFSVIAEDYQKLILPGMTFWQHPSFFGYFPSGYSFEAILGDLYASSTPNPGFNWLASPACTELEAVVMDWAAKLLGLSEAFLNTTGVGGGVIQTSASDAVLAVVVAARALYLSQHPDAKLESLIVYTTTQTHSVGAKAALVLGLSTRSLDVSEKDNLSLRGETLRRALEEDTAGGRIPFILVATLGTTSSGAVDNIEEIGEVVRDYPSLWIHVDAAWAGLALVCPEYREQCRLEAINQYANSFGTNFHKWGLTNFDLSALWVRDRIHLTNALDITPPFLRTPHGDAGTVIDYRNWHLGLGRRFRSLKLWFVLRSYGVEGFQKYIRQTIKFNDIFASLIGSAPHFELVTPPSFALTVFRLSPQSTVPLSLEKLNELNKAYHSRISARKDILLTQTEINGVFCIRFSIGSPRTEESHIRKAFDLLSSEAEVILKEL